MRETAAVRLVELAADPVADPGTDGGADDRGDCPIVPALGTSAYGAAIPAAYITGCRASRMAQPAGSVSMHAGRLEIVNMDQANDRAYLPLAVVALSAILALALGSTVYLLDRDWSSVSMLAPLSAWQPEPAGWFGSLGYTLPSFLHAYAFAALLILALRPSRLAPVTGALCWFLVAAALEFMQAEIFRNLVAETASRLSMVPLIAGIKDYAMNGSFDPGDVRATACGCIAAYTVTTFAETRP